MVALRTLGLLPDLTLRLAEDSLARGAVVELSSIGMASTFSKLCIVVSMVAVGLETQLRPLVAALITALAGMTLAYAGVGLLAIG